ncbi:MAG: WG repeat-containing protein [Saprospiraceae bacterium]|nr:WG repeat-containing protein [Candidatus Defluviibacterium haderslevense]
MRFKYLRHESKRSLLGYTFDDKSVLLDSIGNETSKYYDEIEEISSEQFSLYKVSLNSRYGVIDIHGQEIIKPIYEEIEDLEDLGFKVKSGENYGVLNMEGKTVVPFVHKSRFRFDGMNSISYKFMEKLYDYNGEQKYGFDHDNINEDYQNYLLTFTKNEKKGIYNIIEKKIVIEAKYDNIYPYGSYWDNKKFIVTIGDCYGLVDIKGNPIYKTVYERIVYDQNTNLTALKYNSLFYIYNSKGKLISPMGFEEVRFNSFEPIIVKRNGMYGAINKSGRIIIEFKYTELDFIDLNPGEWFNYSVCKRELFP